MPSVPPKPVTALWRPELTRLPELHFARRAFRSSARFAARILIRLLTRCTISGSEHFPSAGPALIAINHLGDADVAILLAGLPVAPEGLVKVEMYDFPVLGRLMDWYGVIWLHRGQPDRRALRITLRALEQGRFVLVAPEGRYTLAGGLEQGGKGAAYLAMGSGVKVIPVALTGTDNENIYSHLRRFRRPRISLTIGEPLHLLAGGDRTEMLEANTQEIMEALADLLPVEQRGAYR